MVKFSIYENETISELNDRMASYRAQTSYIKRDWRDLPRVHHPTEYAHHHSIRQIGGDRGRNGQEMID